MAIQMRVGVKQGWILGLCGLIGIVLTLIFSNQSGGNKESQTQKVKEQKVNTGSIDNYNAGRDVKIENNTYNGILQNVDSIKKPDTFANRIWNQKTNIHEQTNVKSINQKGGQTAGSITNNH
jgi:hypothetical protein